MTTIRHSYLVGLIGAGIGASLTPAMHEREGDLHGMRYLYNRIDLLDLNLDLSALPELLLAAERMGFAGLNITHPCKQEVIQYLDEVSEEAAAIGAVNTIVFSPQGRIGYNTDATAFLRSFQSEIGTEGIDNIILIGAGGAGTAVAHVLAESGIKRLTIFDIRQDSARKLVEKLQSKYTGILVDVGVDMRSAMGSADGVINATPMGMASEPGIALSPQLLRPSMWVADIVYFPIETELLRHARSLGCKTMDGGGMAVYQAAGSFQLFTGTAADSSRMVRHFRELINGDSDGRQRKVV